MQPGGQGARAAGRAPSASSRHVVQYGEAALRGARRWLTPAIVTDLNTLQAKAYARMGDREGCHASMRRSEEMAARIHAREELP